MRSPWWCGLLVGGCVAQSVIDTTRAGGSESSGGATSSGEPAPTTGSSTTAASTSTGLEETTTGAGAGLLLVGGKIVGGGVADIRVADGKITAIGALTPGPGDEVIDVTGRFIAPAFIDSHVHLLYLPLAAEMAAGGVAGVVDLAAPLEIFDTPLEPLRVRAAGPMITALQGYPTQSWGAGGYGLECADAAAATAAVEQLHDLGAALIKLPITSGPQLDDAALAAATARAHELGLPVVSHALSDEQARRAAIAGVDVLAHTPTEPLAPSTVKLWSGRAVVSTLRAFGGSPAAVGNLQALRAAGVTVLYGTDFGNTSTPGIDGAELMLLQQAGLSPQDILTAGTGAPADLWFGDDAPLGAVATGKDASLLVLVDDPLQDPLTLTQPVAVYIRGARVSP